MDSLPPGEVYSPREIARAAGVPVEHVLVALGGRDGFVSHADAVGLGRELMAARRTPLGLFHSSGSAAPSKGLPLALSSTLHAGILAGAIFVATFGLTPTATTLGGSDERPPAMQLVFIATPGPGGGGGGGGRLQKGPPPKALREGHRAVSSPMPETC